MTPPLPRPTSHPLLCQCLKFLIVRPLDLLLDFWPIPLSAAPCPSHLWPSFHALRHSLAICGLSPALLVLCRSGDRLIWGWDPGQQVQ
ncbi:hypothetical protein B0H10DRAFT_2233546 [Mycena sp. CBHHK59/15]|nr:hypothetical protein B0H10DRAFT_2233546 [Mycena sp. CBHHK59/15]